VLAIEQPRSSRFEPPQVTPLGQSVFAPHLQLPPLQVVLPPSGQVEPPEHVGVVAEQWLASYAPVPLQLLPVQLPHVTQTPLLHWLSLVHQHWPLPCSTPVGQLSLGVADATVSVVSATQLWASTVAAARPVHDGLAHSPLLQSLSAAQMQSVLPAFGVPVEHV
jgi:hypothetical protein